MRSLTDLRLAWGARPGTYAPVVWALILALDALPWPWGEEILARCFVARAFVRRERFRQALAWARAQPVSSRPPRRLARSLCAYHGRFVARSALVGMRDPDTVRRHVTVRGEEHLAAAGTGAILLGFHLGPAQSYLALRALPAALGAHRPRPRAPSAGAPMSRKRALRPTPELTYRSA
jgi:lauroyl/myristoyl acyltransferase